jgi:aldehyde dehydrogenase (NAD+)
MHWANVDGN